jgi:ribosomal-protein-alanine N-acetyltransferase
MKTILETERLILREFEPSDVDDLSCVLCDRENMRFYPDGFERSHVERWIARSRERYRRDGFGLWAMMPKNEPRVIGDCGLMLQEVDGVTEVEIGYHLRRDQQGRGLATEAARACRDFAFGSLGKRTVISLIRPENIPSRRVAERNGMTIEKETLFKGLPHLVYRIAVSDILGV